MTKNGQEFPPGNLAQGGSISPLMSQLKCHPIKEAFFSMLLKQTFPWVTFSHIAHFSPYSTKVDLFVYLFIVPLSSYLSSLSTQLQSVLVSAIILFSVKYLAYPSQVLKKYLLSEQLIMRGPQIYHG